MVDSVVSPFQIAWYKYSGHTEETFAGRILISGTDLLKRQLATIRSRVPLRATRAEAEGVAIVWWVFNKLGPLMRSITVSTCGFP